MGLEKERLWGGIRKQEIREQEIREWLEEELGEGVREMVEEEEAACCKYLRASCSTKVLPGGGGGKIGKIMKTILKNQLCWGGGGGERQNSKVYNLTPHPQQFQDASVS